jgi:hypothetical protein
MTPLLTGVFASQISGHLNTFTPTGSYDAITSYTVGAGGASTITFSGIPSEYKHLQIRATLLGSGLYGNFRVGTNSVDTGSNYAFHGLSGVGAGGTGAMAWSAGTNTTSMRFFGMNSDPGSASYPWTQVIDILDYNNPNKYKTIRSLWGADGNGAGEVGIYSGHWRSTNQISSVQLLAWSGASPSTFNQYSTFALYGVKG